MAVAAPTMDVGDFPKKEDIRVFRVPPGTFVKMHAGTWHAGPLFRDDIPHMVERCKLDPGLKASGFKI